MAIVRKAVLEPGLYESPDGVVDATPERIRHWCDSHRRLRANQVEIPAPWGHQNAALPVDPNAKIDKRAFLSSRFNAGYLQDLIVGPGGEMVAVLDAPGLEVDAKGNLTSNAQLPDGTPVKTAIKEVSIAVGDWTDGHGTLWPDVVNHVALTPLPVWSGQSPFQQMATGGNKLTFLSTLTRMGSMAEKKDDPEELAEDIEAAANPDDAPESDAATPIEEMLQPETVGADPNEERVQRLCGLLGSNGAPLPPDTTIDNFLERLETALGVLLARHQASLAEEAKVENAPADEGQVQEENPPAGQMLMSTIRGNPFLEGLVRSEVSRRSKHRAAKLAEFKTRGLPVDVANKLSGSKVRLSTMVSAAGKLQDDETDRLIEILDRVLPQKEFAATYLSTVSRRGRTPVADPASASSAADEPTEKVGTIPMSKKQKADLVARGSRVGVTVK